MDEPLRVALMVFTLAVEASGGGITRFALDLAKNLDPQRFKLTICALGDFGTIPETERIALLNEQGIRTFTGTLWQMGNPYASFLRAIKTFRREFSRQPVDILHSHSEFTDIAALYLKILSVAPRIVRTIHNGHPLEWRKRPHRRWLLTNFLYPIYYDAEIGVSQHITDRLNRRWVERKLSRRAWNIGNAINLARFQDVKLNITEFKRSLGIPPKDLIVGTIGRLEHEKDYQSLLSSAQLVLEKRLDVTFIFVGEGSLRQTLMNQARNLGISEHVLFTGSRADIEKILKSMDIFACSSLWEGLPSAVLESMASGVPVVSVDIPGTRALIQHGFNGWLVSPQSSPSLADGILELLSQPELRTELAMNARATAQNYSIDRVAKSHEKLYWSLK